MPTYQYACTECDHSFETVQSFTDAALTDCPECSGRLRKLFGAVGIVFKGSGFYRTDSRAGSSGPKTSGAKTSDAKSTDAKSTDAKSTGSTSGTTSSNGSSGSSGSNASSSSSTTTASSAAAS